MDVKIHEKLGDVRIADEVIASIAGLAATEAKGICALAGDIAHDQITHSGSKSLLKAVKVDVDDNVVALRIALIVDGSVPIPDAAKDASERVKNAVESMTGMEVGELKVTIAGVRV